MTRDEAEKKARELAEQIARTSGEYNIVTGLRDALLSVAAEAERVERERCAKAIEAYPEVRLLGRFDVYGARAIKRSMAAEVRALATRAEEGK